MAILFLGLLMLSSSALVSAADPWPNLPPDVATLTVVDGTTSYFVSTLSGVPGGYDVSDGVYAGWCIERTHNMYRNVGHGVILYSSLDPPDVLNYIDWVAINYILNNHQGATMMDVQDAIWHYTDNYPVTGNALALVNAAEANPGYDPTTGDILAVICLRQNPVNKDGAQNSIIELSRSELTGLSPGYWKHNVKVYNGGPGSYSGTPNHETDETMRGYAASILVAHQSEITSQDPNVDTVEEFLVWANTRFQDNQYKDGTPSWLELANWFNVASGRSLYTGEE